MIIIRQEGYNTIEENVAKDRLSLSQYEIHSIREPDLRLYGWTPPGFSLGYSQRPEEVLNIDRCRKEGISWANRITAGEVVYHTSDSLGYTLVMHRLAPARRLFEKIAQCLIELYRSIGIEAYLNREKYPDAKRQRLCFANLSFYDIIAKSTQKKIGSNALRIGRKTVLIQGVIPLSPLNLCGISHLLRCDTSTIVIKSTSIGELLCRRIDFCDIKQLFARVFSTF